MVQGVHQGWRAGRQPGQTYAIEVTIKKGFHWDQFDEVEIELAFAASDNKIAGKYIHKRDLDTRYDHVVTLDCVNFVELGGTVDVPFTFKKVTVGKLIRIP